MANKKWLSVTVLAIASTLIGTSTFINAPVLALNSNLTDVHTSSSDDPSYKAAMASNEAIAAINKNDWQAARNVLEEAVKLDPNGASCMVHTNLGLVLEHFKEFDQAFIHLTAALKFSPKDKSALEDMGSYYQQTGNPVQAINYFETYLSLYPNANDASTVRQLIGHLKKLKVTKVDPTAKDYFAEGTQGNFHRYSTADGPLRVYIADAAEVSGYKPQYGEFLTQALDQWTAATQGLTWTKVDDPKQAEMTCKWTAVMADTKGASSAEAGYAESSALGHEIKSSRVTVCTVAVAGADVNDDSIRFACFHEIGHGLGLTGHSPYSDDVMFFSERQSKLEGLSDRDKATIAKLYQTDLQQK